MHYLPRHLEKRILEASRYFKAILLLGARQVGKSTLLTHLFPHVKTIVFDPIQDIYDARRDPDFFLDAFPAPLILDEIQYVPELLAALKRRMDRSDAKGQYFLTGSQNFSMLRSIAESMAGRVAIFHLDNFTPQEILGEGMHDGWLTGYLDDPEKFYEKRSLIPNDFPSLAEFLFHGTFPAAYALPTTQLPLYFQSYLHTYVDRDVRLQEDIRQLAEFNRFLSVVASLTAQEINTSQLGREIGISPNTARRWLDILAFTYQWHELLPFYGNTIKRISGKRKGYFKDTGFACYLQRMDSVASLVASPHLGAIFETWVVNYISQQCAMMSTPPYLYHWRTAGGAEVDLVLEKNGKLYPIEIKCKTNPNKGDLSGIKAFRQTYPNDEIMTGMIFHAGSEIFKLDPDTIAIPWRLQ